MITVLTSLRTVSNRKMPKGHYETYEKKLWNIRWQEACPWCCITGITMMLNHPELGSFQDLQHSDYLKSPTESPRLTWKHGLIFARYLWLPSPYTVSYYCMPWLPAFQLQVELINLDKDSSWGGPQMKWVLVPALILISLNAQLLSQLFLFLWFGLPYPAPSNDRRCHTAC